VRLDISPMSVNKAWQGKRYRTDVYKRYQKDIASLLRPMSVPEGLLEIHITWGFSSSLSDFDNPVKPFVDCLQAKYEFNDRVIKRAIIDVDMVEKGREYIEFELLPLSSLLLEGCVT